MLQVEVAACAKALRWGGGGVPAHFKISKEADVAGVG